MFYRSDLYKQINLIINLIVNQVNFDSAKSFCKDLTKVRNALKPN